MPRPFLALAPLAAGLLLAGCAAEEDQTYEAVDAHGHDDEHAHAAAEHADVGPHGGAIVELTADHSLHGELVVDGDDPARGRFYLLGMDLKTPVAADGVAIFFDDPETGGEVNLELQPAGGGTEGGEWTFLRERLPNDGAGPLVGRVKVTADGRDYEEAFNTADDDHAGHDHGDHEGHDHD